MKDDEAAVATTRHVLPYGKQLIDDDDIAAVVSALKSDFLTQGPAVRHFEDALCSVTGAKYCVAVANGTAALHLACLAAGVRQGDAGITSTITFVASANAIRYAGGTPYLTDVNPETGLLSSASLEARIAELARVGKKPKVVIPVDFAGTVVNLPKIREIATKTGALVIEDAAHALGATYETENDSFRAASCAHADMAILSFHPVKHVTTGEGGAITTNDESIYRELLDLRTHGITKDEARLHASDGPWYYEQQSLGYNYRITDFQCALGASQLKKLDRFIERRRAIAEHYDAAFGSDPSFRGGVVPLRVRAGVKSAYHLYVLRIAQAHGEALERVAARRKSLFSALRELAIFAQVHYIPVHRQPDYVKNGLGAGAYPGADAYYASCISLPMFPAMADGDVDRVIAAVRGWVAGIA